MSLLGTKQREKPDVRPVNEASTAEAPAIEVRDLGFSYGEEPVFRHLSLQVGRHEFVGLIGANGAGKSTLVRLILGLEKPTEGEVLLFGQKQESFRDWGRIGYVSQKAAAFNSAFPGTVREVVLANLYSKIGLLRRPKKEHHERVEEALCRVGMQDYSKRLIGQLSGGQQQRVFLARVLVNDPELILLDEPTVGIDARSEGELYQLLHKLNEENGMGVLLVSHDIGAVTVHTKRLLCMGADGFFEHDHIQPLDQATLKRIYGYSVYAHSHLLPGSHAMGTEENCELCHPCACGHTGPHRASEACDPDSEDSKAPNTAHTEEDSRHE